MREDLLVIALGIAVGALVILIGWLLVLAVG